MNATLPIRSAREPRSSDVTAPAGSLIALSARLRGEYREMPGLRLTVRQAARLFGLDLDVAETVLDQLRHAGVLMLATDGAYSLVNEPSRWAASSEAATRGSLRDASVERLAALQRHWTWADEAMARFDHELAEGWGSDERMTVRPFGAYAHWCALLCAFAEGALRHSLLSPPQLDPIRLDLEASVPTLQACRHLLTVVPASLDHDPRIVDLIHDDALPRLRRIHRAFGQALRDEQANRGVHR
jgi:hypothetical protein